MRLTALTLAASLIAGTASAEDAADLGGYVLYGEYVYEGGERVPGHFIIMQGPRLNCVGQYNRSVEDEFKTSKLEVVNNVYFWRTWRDGSHIDFRCQSLKDATWHSNK